jgi:hypothetical protein
MSEARDEYIRAIFTLSKSDPAAWASFLEAFKAHIGEELERLLRMPNDDAQIGLGWARCLVSLRSDFSNIEELMRKITKT